MRIIRFLITLYRRLKSRKYPVCKYYPSCSDYALISIEKYGIFIGSLKAIWRFLRCNPFSKGGIDLP
ncbi:MAG: membrane protein insertion efficiency factor YidD [Candidatus Calescibacterium sp.]|nr:membrane protein insertion efficiency factor YidD [Candidatus Calescibacterium sp.]MCX7972397.1 membrane protein insertion efficiency factor YidD [bacterium]MDW8195712.1 membrane protein insertion efficiency factor YidD [Candidatus Calescibacterium sp.]